MNESLAYGIAQDKKTKLYLNVLELLKSRLQNIKTSSIGFLTFIWTVNFQKKY